MKIVYAISINNSKKSRYLNDIIFLAIDYKKSSLAAHNAFTLDNKRLDNRSNRNMALSNILSYQPRTTLKFML